MTAARVHDVVIVGAGATGLWAAKQIAEAGPRVLLLDAGPEVDIAALAKTTPGSDLVRLLAAPADDHPYTAPADRPFRWYGRVRAVGGRMNVWSGGCLRMSDFELAAGARDGHGDAWPMSHADVAPHYDR